MLPPKAADPRDVYLLPLTDDGAPDVPGGYISLPPPSAPPYQVRFSIEGTSSICRQGSLCVNVPAPGVAFDRSKFREFKLAPDFHRNIEITIPIVLAGVFAFYTTYTPLPPFSISQVGPPTSTRTPTYYIDVSPRLAFKAQHLPLDGLSIFSVLSKFMGNYPNNWHQHLQGIRKRGYNMIHLAPLMQTGDSLSPYSIADHFTFDPTSFPNGESDIEDLVVRMEREHKLLSLTDVVWNHTANNSKWIESHPEAGYNLETAPWLESALELDDALCAFGRSLASHGVPTEVTSEGELDQLMEGIKVHVLDQLQLWQYYVVDVELNTKAAVASWKAGTITFPRNGFKSSGLGGLEDIKEISLQGKAAFLKENGLESADRLGGRYSRKVDASCGAALLQALVGRPDQISDPSIEYEAESLYRSILDELNLPFYQEYDTDRATILEQTRNRIKYLRLDAHGPRLGPFTEQRPLIETYFTRLPDNDITRKHGPRGLALVNNGWVWSPNALMDQAGPGSRAYLRRELVVWTDCVKLRYGDSPQDSPFLWDYMSRYTRLMAKYFAGFRIDNCHSTPIFVAEHLLDEARSVRPNLYVCAELFTGSEPTDYVFVKRLGINSLVREAMKAWSPGDLSRSVHRHGGRPIGSFELDEVVASNQESENDGIKASVAPTKPDKQFVHRIKETPVHAAFIDCTHDNDTPAQKGDARDTLPSGALVAMCACAIGSVMGYDEVYPKLVDLVKETRLYASPYSNDENIEAIDTGVGKVKRLMNDIHTRMGIEGYDESYIHHEGDFITVHRVHPQTREGFFLIARTAFPGQTCDSITLSPTVLQATTVKALGSWRLEVDVSDEAKSKVLGDPHYLKGLPSRIIEAEGFTTEEKDGGTVISVGSQVPPGSIAMFQTRTPSVEHADGLDAFVTSGAKDAFQGVDLVDLNAILYRCEPEERDSSGGTDGVYAIPGNGPLVYAGLQGWWSVLKWIIQNNDLGHPLCQHLRDGKWALDYIVNRMERMVTKQGYTNLANPTNWFRSRFDVVRAIPSYLLPRYFALIVQTAYGAAWERGISLMSEDIREGQDFLKNLAMVSVQQMGYMSSASLYPKQTVPCLAAGLPHFAADWARCWGRDVFISLRGLLIATGRYDEAKEHILAFGSVLKHGMIPNLLSGGRLPRYNARDSIWFYLQSVQDYSKIVPNGLNILRERVKRRFLPYDDTWFDDNDSRAYSNTTTIEDIIQEALQRHASGLSFREANAGPGLDMQMKPEGFQIDVNVDWKTGLIFGGNQHNCGTWMDKMGESVRAGSKGVPGTSRDGAAIEISGLLYSTLRWLGELHGSGHYKYAGVKKPGRDGETITFQDWASKIKENFEPCYYVPMRIEDDKFHDVNPAVVNRRGIYKDLYRSGKEYEDYQLRPNFPIAMCVAPELFVESHALGALVIADDVLRGPTGMATLDPSDMHYRPYYDNSEDSDDFATAKGRNYHQGPEWLWPTGYFLRALLRFDFTRRSTPEERTETFQQITIRLKGCKAAIKSSPWAGLTELTNKNGEFCGDSSPTQAWSAACLIDVFHDAKAMSLGGSATGKAVNVPLRGSRP
ncbi:MAG: hypothetical protein M1817_001746 [Caeruleum heppii]|nr:MAG: hypothetical protein M1817_001746 [Caeruleum heppii]